MPTAALEEYLEAIYKIAEAGTARPTQIAEAVGVSGPTVTATLRRLETRGLITRDGTGVVLTVEGTARALDIIRRHRIAESFLVNVLGLDWEAAHEEACTLEHALSPRVLAALETFLDNPAECPHGHPIPSADGIVEPVTGQALSELSAGTSAYVLRVAENDDEVLGYLGSVGLRPGVEVLVLEKAPFRGPLTLVIDGAHRAIAYDIASLVTVAVA